MRHIRQAVPACVLNEPDQTGASLKKGLASPEMAFMRVGLWTRKLQRKLHRNEEETSLTHPP
jgi:hypothetical protein